MKPDRSLVNETGHLDLLATAFRWPLKTEPRPRGSGTYSCFSAAQGRLKPAQGGLLTNARPPGRATNPARRPGCGRDVRPTSAYENSENGLREKDTPSGDCERVRHHRSANAPGLPERESVEQSRNRRDHRQPPIGKDAEPQMGRAEEE